MKNKVIYIVMLSVCWLISSECLAAARGQASIDLRSARLNGKPLTEWTLDEITDTFGRPTAVTAGIAGLTGSQLHYHSRGLSFWFLPKEKDPRQHLSIVTVYLSRNWDNDNSIWYDTFKERLSPAIDANWKQSQIVKEFATLNPTIKTVEESKKELEAAGIANLGIRGPQTDFVNITIENFEVTFAIEPNTKFVERIVLKATDKTQK